MVDRAAQEPALSVDVITICTIDRPCDVVAAYAANPDNAPAWYVNIKSVAWKSPPPFEWDR